MTNARNSIIRAAVLLERSAKMLEHFVVMYKASPHVVADVKARTEVMNESAGQLRKLATLRSVKLGY